MLLFGNKMDKPDKVITSETGAEYARENGWGFMEVSAKEGSNIFELFHHIADKLIDRYDKHNGIKIEKDGKGQARLSYDLDQ